MTRKIRNDSSLKSVCKLMEVNPKTFKTPTGRKVRSDIKVKTLRKRSK